MDFDILTAIDEATPSCYCPDCLRAQLARQAASAPPDAGPQST